VNCYVDKAKLLCRATDAVDGFLMEQIMKFVPVVPVTCDPTDDPLNRIAMRYCTSPAPGVSFASATPATTVLIGVGLSGVAQRAI